MERLQTGVRGLDEMLRGGILPGSTTLVQGAPGTGKTTLALQFLTCGALHGNEPGVFITFEEFPRDLYRDAASLGWNLRQGEAENRLRVIFTSPEALLADLDEPGGRLEQDIQRLQARRVVLDSVTQFREVSADPIELRRVYRRLVNGLKRAGVTTVLTAEDYHLLGHQDEPTHGLAFLVDTIILLRYVEIESSIRRAILVLKMRGSDHDKEIRQFRITSRGLEIESPFRGREGVLSGIPYTRLGQRAAEVFG